MASNLRSKISSSDSMFIHDVNPAVTEQFAKEVGNVTVAENVRQVAENSVGLPFLHATTPCRYLMSLIVLSMI